MRRETCHIELYGLLMLENPRLFALVDVGDTCATEVLGQEWCSPVFETLSLPFIPLDCQYHKSGPESVIRDPRGAFRSWDTHLGTPLSPIPNE